VVSAGGSDDAASGFVFESEKMAFAAPRILKEPVPLQVFALEEEFCAGDSVSEDEVRTGVRWILGAMRAWAGEMASQLGWLVGRVFDCGAVLISLALAGACLVNLFFSA